MWCGNAIVNKYKHYDNNNANTNIEINNSSIVITKKRKRIVTRLTINTLVLFI